MSDTLLGIIIGSVAAPLVLEIARRVLAWARDRAEVRQIEHATARDDFKTLIAELRQVWNERMNLAQQRHAAKLERWIGILTVHTPGSPEHEKACASVMAEVRAEIEALLLTGPLVGD